MNEELCKIRKRNYMRKYRKENAEKLRKYNLEYKERHKQLAKEHRLKHRERFMLRGAKRRAKEKGLPFNLIEEDIIIPEICPILGIKLESCGLDKGCAPSLDRLIPELGYVKGNVSVISHRANSLKSNMSIEEIIKMAEWAQSR